MKKTKIGSPSCFMLLHEMKDSIQFDFQVVSSILSLLTFFFFFILLVPIDMPDFMREVESYTGRYLRRMASAL